MTFIFIKLFLSLFIYINNRYYKRIINIIISLKLSITIIRFQIIKVLLYIKKKLVYTIFSDFFSYIKLMIKYSNIKYYWLFKKEDFEHKQKITYKKM